MSPFSHSHSPPHLPSKAFSSILFIFHIFPFHAPLTLFLIDAPFGRFSIQKSKLNVPGNLTWAAMELVSPITMLTTLVRQSAGQSLPTTSTILATLFLIHYSHRAIVSPLILSPTRSPMHIFIPFAAGLFNLINGYLMGYGFVHYPSNLNVWSPRFWVPLLGWAAGFAGNIYHDEILNDLRRPAGQKLVTRSKRSTANANGGNDEKETTDPSGRYKIPQGGLFKLVSFPNYLCEWVEWTCFALAASPVVTIPTPPIIGVTTLLSPAWTFVLATITCMFPRAVRGHAWYRRQFGDRYPPERKAVVPWLL